MPEDSGIAGGHRGPGRRTTTRAADVVATFQRAAATHGFPASVLANNGAIFTAAPRGGGRCAIGLELARLGIAYRHSRAYHPQTCGKVERLYQTFKKRLTESSGHQRTAAS
jgi:transposase InsO family protein